MRIKTVPRHRMLQRSTKVASATKLSSDEETAANVEDYDSVYTIDNQDPYHQVYGSPSTNFTSITTSTISGSKMTLTSSTSISPSLPNNNHNSNIDAKRGATFQKGQIYVGEDEKEENMEVVNLSTKDASNRVDKIATGSPTEPEDKLKDTFLYKIMTDPNFLENIQRNKQPKKFVCLFCKEDFTSCEELTSHMDAKKNDSNQITCCACKKTFAEKRYLKYHRRCHSERTKFTCDICTRKYTRLDNLTRHNVLHVNPDKFSCTICNRTFTRKDLLNKHRKSHEKYNLYCEKCGKYFRRVLTLENHQKTHRKISKTAEHIAFSKAENLAFAENIDCRTENIDSAGNTLCKADNLTLGESLVCKTKDLACKT